MIRVVYGRDFLASVRKLPPHIQKKLDALLGVVQINPYDPRLHTKRLAGELAGFLSFRITRDWRVFFIFLSAETIQLIRAEHRKDIYR